MAKTKKLKNEESKSSQDDKAMKGKGLFDHIKEIRSNQDPNYFKSLTELDLKSFNHFMILKALSMNPALLDDVAVLYRYFDLIPSPQFYQLLISLIPADRKFYPWVKAKKKHKFSKELIKLVSKKYEVSPRESTDYIRILSSLEDGQKQLHRICQGFGHTDKEIEKILSSDDEDES